MSLISKNNLIINNRYKILEDKEKGSGTFSNVYLAEDLTNQKHFAVKILKTLTPDFEKEISILQKVSSINNPYIVNLVDSGNEFLTIGENPGYKQYAILEYCSRGELFDFIEKTEFGLKEKYAKFLFRKILKGVQAFHNLGICHRDLKLENILLDEYFNPKICDFGFATEIEGKNNSGKLTKFLGSKNYAAPEMSLNKPYNGIKADIFSLGVILFNLATGKNGFIEANINDPYYKYIINHHYSIYWKIVQEIIGEIPDEIKTLYIKMVNFNEEKRPTIEEILNDSWMKEINDLNEMEYKALEQEVYQEFKKACCKYNNDENK